MKRHELHIPEELRYIRDYKGFDRLHAKAIEDCLVATRMMRVILEDVLERLAISTTVTSPSIVESLAIALDGRKL